MSKPQKDYRPNKPQVRILEALEKVGKAGQVGEKLFKAAKLATRAWLSEYLGTADGGMFIRAGGEDTDVRKLVPNEFVRAERITVEEATERHPAVHETRYYITGTGKVALHAALKEAAAKSDKKSKPKKSAKPKAKPAAKKRTAKPRKKPVQSTPPPKVEDAPRAAVAVA